MLGIGYLPVTGGLFLGSDATNALAAAGSFPITQDQRNTVRSRFRYEVTPRLDLKLNEKNTLVLSYSYMTNSQSGQGVSGFSLPTFNGVSRAYSTDSGEESLRATETAILNPTTIHASDQ
jgi:hypothetical protein